MLEWAAAFIYCQQDQAVVDPIFGKAPPLVAAGGSDEHGAIPPGGAAVLRRLFFRSERLADAILSSPAPEPDGISSRSTPRVCKVVGWSFSDVPVYDPKAPPKDAFRHRHHALCLSKADSNPWSRHDQPTTLHTLMAYYRA